MKITYKHSSSVPREFAYKCNLCANILIKEFLMSEMPSSIECECGGEAIRYIDKPPRIALDPISGDFYTATRKWEKARESKMRQEKKNLENHGSYD